jgi:hypothetical protein
MRWIKKGLIFCPEGEFSWSQAYASVPTVDIIADKLRIYYATRNQANQSSIGFIETDAEHPDRILYVHEQPVLIKGQPGMFDDCGVMPSMLINHGQEKWLYYIGWNVRNTISYHNAIGLAISKDGGLTFEKFSEGPLFDRDYREPYFSAAPFILKEHNLWRMWYLSNTKWVTFNGKTEPFYHIKYAESHNGIDWQRQGKIAIDFKDAEECGIVRACVIKDAATYKMWYSYRNLNNYRSDKSNSYRIGYAHSKNGVDWVRADEQAGIDISNTGWDSEMIEYPYVYAFKGRYYMLYNGNCFGKTGFGYAVLESL